MVTPPSEQLASTTPDIAAERAETASGGGFSVSLANFDGPFDLLLTLISQRKLDITEVALAQVTDEFIAYLRYLETTDQGWDLSDVSEFVVVAATLLDLKAARLLPSGDVEDAEDLALLEARDLLFARLLQYRAYKDVSASFAESLSAGSRRIPRAVQLEPQLAGLLPDLIWSIGPEQLAMLAAGALSRPKQSDGVDISHLHAPAVSVREQAALLVDRLRRSRTASFRDLIADAPTPPFVIGRFLALLELFREGVVSFDQVDPLGELSVRWTGSDEGDIDVKDDYDEETPDVGS